MIAILTRSTRLLSRLAGRLIDLQPPALIPARRWVKPADRFSRQVDHVPPHLRVDLGLLDSTGARDLPCPESRPHFASRAGEGRP